jgi:hypothetical protein
MSGHVEAAAALRAALVRGDMETFRGAAADLSGDERDDEVWDVNLDVMRVAARRARDAEDPARGAEMLARIGEACSHCHVMLGDPKLPIPPEPPADQPTTDPDARRRMRRHEWAAAALWTGLAAPSEDAWRRGASVLASELESVDAARRRGAPPEVIELTEQAGRAAVAAQAAKPGERRRPFADVMATCAPCHEALDVVSP